MKDLFLLDPSVVFLNHGSFGACPVSVLEEQWRWQREMERNPVEFLGRRSAQLLEKARTALARLLGASADELVFLSNTTHGVNAVARSVPLSEGDEVLTTDHEYGACDATWEAACRRAGARYVRASIPLPFVASEFADRVLEKVTPRTRVVYLSHLTSTTALTFPVAEVCRRARQAGILTVIDGAHVPGHLPLDLAAVGADFYTGNLHKWLCAPKGAAFLWARPERHAMLEPLVVSWGSCAEVAGHTGFDAYTGTTTLERRLQWQGTRDLSAFLSVPAAIEFQRAHGWDGVRARCHDLAVKVRERVRGLTGLGHVCAETDFAQMVALPFPKTDPAALKEELWRRRIEIPVTTHGDHVFVRLSVQGYNSDEDVDRLVAALEEILAAR
ncbi:MAG TPA: aminotransferase class V-fold PLP-dependent enzyme [Myxococcales bacterium]|jgi:isopenicillin-N epimerase